MSSSRRRSEDEAGPSDSPAPATATAPSSSSKRKRDATQSSYSYDPRQDVGEKRELRKAYRGILAEQDVARSNLAEIGAKDLSDMIRRGDELYEKVKAPNEGVLDSKLLLGMSEIGAQLARSMKVATGSFDLDEYLARLAGFVGGQLRTARGGATRGGGGDDDEDEDIKERWDWDRLGRAAARCSRRAPAMDCLLGPLEVTQKQRTVTKRTKLQVDGPAVKPQQLKEDDIARSENETTRLVKSLADILEDIGGEKGVNMFKFLIDPNSFSNTVENFFHASFLVRDGIMSLEDVDGEPILLRVEPPDEQDYADGLPRRQLVFEIDMALWRELIETYEIREAMIPSRAKHQKLAAGANKGAWYG